MRFARIVFFVAGVYGLLVLLPQYFMEDKTGHLYPPPVTHPEYYYGFIGVAVAWQVLFLVMAQDPARYRVVMLPAILEKASYGVATAVLYAQDRVATVVLVSGIIDLIFGALFVAAYLKTSDFNESSQK